MIPVMIGIAMGLAVYAALGVKQNTKTIKAIVKTMMQMTRNIIQLEEERVVKPEWCPLKEQEAKCLTKAELDDLNENQFVWIEGRTGYLYCLQIIGICREKTVVSDIQFNAPTSYVERSTNRYGKSYRIWTNKPTEEQRQEVKWDESKNE